ncbi:MAG: histidine phosphatase family protein [Silicimonas sp.]|nr:histidine phosphatase family protein [Silicimonas sp.]
MSHPDLWILRHGQTQWNLAGRMQGWKDSPLTALGQSQARQQNALLQQADLPRDVGFHVSPLGRCRATAELALAGLCDAPLVDDRLKEVSVGMFEGLTLRDVETDWPGITDTVDGISFHYRAPGGERLDGFRARIDAWLQDLSGPTVVVTHGMVSREMRGILLGLDAAGAADLPGGQGNIYKVSGGEMTAIEA